MNAPQAPHEERAPADATAKRYFEFGRPRAADYLLKDGDVDKLARRIAVSVTEAFRDEIQRMVNFFVVSTMCGEPKEPLSDTIRRVLQVIALGPGFALESIIAAVKSGQDEPVLSVTEAAAVFSCMMAVGIKTERLFDGTITEKELCAVSEHARIELRGGRLRRRRGKPEDLVMQMFVARLVRVAAQAGYDVAKNAEWRAKKSPPLLRFVDDALHLALNRAKSVLQNQRESMPNERYQAIRERLDALTKASERAVATRVAAAVAQMPQP